MGRGKVSVMQLGYAWESRVEPVSAPEMVLRADMEDLDPFVSGVRLTHPSAFT